MDVETDKAAVTIPVIASSGAGCEAHFHEVFTRTEAESALAVARATLREATIAAEYARVPAPFDGRVVARLVDPGDMANPGMPLINLETTGAMKVVAHLAEKDVASVKPGDTITVDGNHPLAGVQLNFVVKVMEIREATTEELEHGHVHGPGGHHH